MKRFETSKAAQRIAAARVSELDRATATELYDVYDSYSAAKANAYRYCRDLCRDLDGYNFRILSHNSNAFTVGFYFDIDGVQHIAYITKDHNRAAALN